MEKKYSNLDIIDMKKIELSKMLIKTSIDCYLSGFGKIKNKKDKVKLIDFIKKVETKYSS